MACTASNGIQILPGVTLSIETLSLALSVVAAIYYFDKYKKDKDNLKSLGDDYVAIGEAYCNAAATIRQRTAVMYDYNRAMPDYNYVRVPKAAKYGTAAFGVRDLHDAYNRLPADAVGMRCHVNDLGTTGIARVAIQGQAEAVAWEDVRHDRYIEQRIKARAQGISGATPQIDSTFATLANSYTESVQDSAQSFNAALHVFGRSAGAMLNRGFF